MKSIFTILIFTASVGIADAQLSPICNGSDKNSMYLVVQQDGYYRIDSLGTNPTDPIKIAGDIDYTLGISLNRRLDSVNGPVVMYAVSGNPLSYSYWTGGNWKQTNHLTGTDKTGNPGGTNDYIFNLDYSSGTIYRYDGTTDATPLFAGLPTSTAAAYDIATDKQGNFYIFFTTAHQVVMFNPNCIAIDTFTTTGTHPAGGMSSFAMANNRFYAIGLASGRAHIYEGIFTGHTISFNDVKTLPDNFIPNDIATCPEASEPAAIFADAYASRFAVYPNPAHGSAIVKLDNIDKLEITDGLGRQMSSIYTRGLTQYHLPLTGWAPGVYYIGVVSPAGKEIRTALIVE